MLEDVCKKQSELEYGDRSKDVYAVQKSLVSYLKSKGIEDLAVEGRSVKLSDIKLDGIFGAQTEALVKRFQREEGLKQTGRVNSKTADKLLEKANSTKHSADASIDIFEQQKNLTEYCKRNGITSVKVNGRTVSLDELKHDGVYGPKTAAFVKKVQQQNGLNDSGRLTKETILAIAPTSQPVLPQVPQIQPPQRATSKEPKPSGVATPKIERTPTPTQTPQPERTPVPTPTQAAAQPTPVPTKTPIPVVAQQTPAPTQTPQPQRTPIPTPKPVALQPTPTKTPVPVTAQPTPVVTAKVTPAPTIKPQATKTPIPTATKQPAVQTPVLPAAEEGQKEENKPLTVNHAATVVHEIYEATCGGIWGAGTDEARLFRALGEIKSKKDADLVRNLYVERTQHLRKLDDDIKGDLSGSDLKRAKLILDGKYIDAKGEELYHQVSKCHWLTSSDEYEAASGLLRNANTPELKQALEYIKKEYKKDLTTVIDDKFSGERLSSLKALTDTSLPTKERILRADAQDLLMAARSFNQDEKKILSIMDRYDKDGLVKLSAACGENIETLAKNTLNETQFLRAKALLGGDKASADAYRVKDALGMFSVDEDEIFETFSGKSKAQNEATARSFAEISNKPLGEVLDGKLDGAEAKIAKAYFDKGYLTEAEEVYKAAKVAIGTDETAILGALEGKTKEEIEKINTEYSGLTGGKESLIDVITSELGGRDEFQATQALKGKPTTIEELASRAKEEHDFERGGAFSRFVTDYVFFSDKGALLDSQLSRVEGMQQTIDKYGASDERLGRLKLYGDFVHQDAESYSEAKNSVAENTAMAGAVAVSMAAEAVTAGAATPLVVAGVSGLAGATAYTGTKYGIQGSSYDGQDLISDIAVGGVSGGIAGGVARSAKLAATAEQAIAQGTQQAARFSAKQLATKALNTGRTLAQDGGYIGAGTESTRQLLNGDTYNNGIEGAITQVGGAGLQGFGAGMAGAGLFRVGAAGTLASIRTASVGVERFGTRIGELKAPVTQYVRKTASDAQEVASKAAEVAKEKSSNALDGAKKRVRSATEAITKKVEAIKASRQAAKAEGAAQEQTGPVKSSSFWNRVKTKTDEILASIKEKREAFREQRRAAAEKKQQQAAEPARATEPAKQPENAQVNEPKGDAQSLLKRAQEVGLAKGAEYWGRVKQRTQQILENIKANREARRKAAEQEQLSKRQEITETPEQTAEVNSPTETKAEGRSLLARANEKTHELVESAERRLKHGLSSSEYALEKGLRRTVNESVSDAAPLEKITIGAGSDANIVVPKVTGLGEHHLLIIKRPRNRFRVEPLEENAVEIKRPASKEWEQITTRVDVPAGTRVRLNNKYEFSLPGKRYTQANAQADRQQIGAKRQENKAALRQKEAEHKQIVSSEIEAMKDNSVRRDLAFAPNERVRPLTASETAELYRIEKLAAEQLTPKKYKKYKTVEEQVPHKFTVTINGKRSEVTATSTQDASLNIPDCVRAAYLWVEKGDYDRAADYIVVARKKLEDQLFKLRLAKAGRTATESERFKTEILEGYAINIDRVEAYKGSLSIVASGDGPNVPKFPEKTEYGRFTAYRHLSEGEATGIQPVEIMDSSANVEPSVKSRGRLLPILSDDPEFATRLAQEIENIEKDLSDRRFRTADKYGQLCELYLKAGRGQDAEALFQKLFLDCFEGAGKDKPEPAQVLQVMETYWKKVNDILQANGIKPRMPQKVLDTMAGDE